MPQDGTKPGADFAAGAGFASGSTTGAASAFTSRPRSIESDRSDLAKIWVLQVLHVT
jgi:hypothetical protein